MDKNQRHNSQVYHLFFQMAKRMILERYQGSFLGVAWSIITPLLMLGLYTIVFSHIFHSRWPKLEDGAYSTGSYAIILFSGLMLHSFFMEVLSQSCTSIIRFPNFVKKIIFPLPVLPLSILVSALFQCCLSMLVLLVLIGISWPELSFTLLVAPLTLLPFLVLTLGLAYLLASLGVYIRDIIPLVQLSGTVFFFMGTILYPASASPEFLRPLLYLNPLSYAVDSFRGALLFGTLPHLSSFLYYTGISLAVFIIGFLFFQKTKRGFADVL